MTGPTRMLLAAVCVLGIMVLVAYLGSLAGPRMTLGGPRQARCPGTVAVRAMDDRLDARAAKDVEMTVGFLFVDTGASCGLQITRGVARFHPDLPAAPDLTIQAGSDVVERILRREQTVQSAVAVGEMEIDGSEAEAARFFSYFAPSPAGPARH
ncbi:MAG TPA: alkyl sulfatase C-terminal domain-containing protein [Phycisphaerae bacterium]|nr:alkyl sulfatase C-terminal domain-containing protein [Phycisphaerae bacterium]